MGEHKHNPTARLAKGVEIKFVGEAAVQPEEKPDSHDVAAVDVLFVDAAGRKRLVQTAPVEQMAIARTIITARKAQALQRIGSPVFQFADVVLFPRELADWPDRPIICDNNLLAASAEHFDRVCDRLERHDWCDFNQGLDARLMNDHHAERIGRLSRAQVRLALDHSSLTEAWTQAYELLRKHKVAKARISTYVLCGHGSDPEDAWQRCQHVDKRGHPAALPQWYHPLDAIEYNAVLPCHRECGWDEAEKNRIMGYYYQHRGELPNKALSDSDPKS